MCNYGVLSVGHENEKRINKIIKMVEFDSVLSVSYMICNCCCYGNQEHWKMSALAQAEPQRN